jgi:hypothetical protein
VIQSGRATVDLLAEAFNNRGTAYADKRDYDTAILDFTKRSISSPNTPTFH